MKCLVSLLLLASTMGAPYLKDDQWEEIEDRKFVDVQGAPKYNPTSPCDVVASGFPQLHDSKNGVYRYVSPSEYDHYFSGRLAFKLTKGEHGNWMLTNVNSRQVQGQATGLRAKGRLPEHMGACRWDIDYADAFDQNNPNKHAPVVFKCCTPVKNMKGSIAPTCWGTTEQSCQSKNRVFCIASSCCGWNKDQKCTMTLEAKKQNDLSKPESHPTCQEASASDEIY